MDLPDLPKSAETTATGRVADLLASTIRLTLHPGDSLPSEADLAVQHQVSRVTVREALKTLAGRGLVDLSRGRRARVRKPSAAALGDFISAILQYDPKGVFDLVEIRLSLEVQSVGLAARRATRPSIAAIESALQAMRDVAVDLDAQGAGSAAEGQFHSADVRFHEALALASGNSILISMFEAMALPLQRSLFISRKGRVTRGQTSSHTIAAHERILNCVRSGDASAAETAMRDHLADAIDDLRAALSLPN